MRFLKPSEVIFAEDKIEKEFLELSEEDEIKKYIKRAINDIKKFAKNFSLMKNFKSFSMPRKSNKKEDFLGLKSSVARPRGIKNDFKIKQNAFCGIPIPKRLFPKEYMQKYQINNLWKYDLPDGWRLVYTIKTPNKVQILSIILEWFNHKDYERKFHY